MIVIRYAMIASMRRLAKKPLPKVSFIIPTLNAGKFLPACLHSIRNQNYPREKIEIIIADAFSTDTTRAIAEKFRAKIIDNPEILHEQGKSRGAKAARGEILFYTDADNVLSTNNWLNYMIKPYLENTAIVGFLPQTIPAPDSNSLDRYFGYICTDPFTWFVYEGITSGREFPKKYPPSKKTTNYMLFKFPHKDPPLYGLSQGAGSSSTFKRGKSGHADDLLAAIKIIKEKGIVAYAPRAGVYHYHVSGIQNYMKKYAWRVRNNLTQQIKGMGVVNRQKFFSKYRRMRMRLFVPYGLSIVFPALDTIRLIAKHKDVVMLWHVPASFLLSLIILTEYIKSKFSKQAVGTYE